jgi:hypothetical protein
VQVQNLSTQLGRTESAFDSERRGAAAPAHLAGPSSGSNGDASRTAPQLFSPRKSLVPFTAANAGVNMRHSFSQDHDPPMHSPRPVMQKQELPSLQPPAFRPVVGQTASLVASIRSHVSRRPSTFLSAPSTLVAAAASAPSSAVPEQHFNVETQSKPFQTEHRPHGVPLSLKDSYSQDAEMWGEHVSPMPPAPAMLPSLAMHAAPTFTSNVVTPRRAEGVGESHRVLTDAFDLVSPVGDVVERSRGPVVAQADAQADAQMSSTDREWQAAAWEHGSAAGPQQREQRLRSPSPETLAIKEATAVRDVVGG